MKTTILTALTATALLSGCIIHVNTDGDWQTSSRYRSSEPHHQGSGVLGSQTRSLPDFERISVEGPLTVVVLVGEAPSVELSGDANLLDFVETSVSENKLRLGLEDGSYEFEEPMVVRIGVQSLTDVDVCGGSSLDLTGLNGEFDLELNAAASVVARGELEELDIEVNSAADVDFSAVKATEVDVEINGTGVVRVHAVDSIEAEINGTGTVIYTGDPSHHDFEINGIGKVRHEHEESSDI